MGLGGIAMKSLRVVGALVVMSAVAGYYVWRASTRDAPQAASLLLFGLIDGYRLEDLRRAARQTTFLNWCNANGDDYRVAYPPLYFAAGAVSQSSEMVKILLDAGADPNKACGGLPTPLHNAASPDTVRLLLGAGANPNARGGDGTTPLLSNVSGTGADFEIVNLLVEAGAEVNASDDKGRTPLIVAAGNMGSRPTLVILLRHGAKVNTSDKGGRTALAESIARPCSDQADQSVKTLIQAGAILSSNAITFEDVLKTVKRRENDEKECAKFERELKGLLKFAR
jgi:hypothetical protein